MRRTCCGSKLRNMDKLQLVKFSNVSSANKASGAPVSQAAPLSLAQRYSERFGTEPFAMYETVLTPAQVARVESLMDVPMDELAMWDDRVDRAILGAQRLKRDLENTPMYRARANKGWAYWSALFGSQVNTLRP